MMTYWKQFQWLHLAFFTLATPSLVSLVAPRPACTSNKLSGPVSLDFLREKNIKEFQYTKFGG